MIRSHVERGLRVGVTIVAVTVVLVGLLGVRVALMRTAPQVHTLPLEPGALRGVTKVIVVSFVVVGGNAQLVGAWYSPSGGALLIRPTNSTTEPNLHFRMCGRPWYGAINTSFRPGTYLLEFIPMAVDPVVVVTKTIQLTYPGAGNASSSFLAGAVC